MQDETWRMRRKQAVREQGEQRSGRENENGRGRKELCRGRKELCVLQELKAWL